MGLRYRFNGCGIAAHVHTGSGLEHWFIQTKGGSLEVEFDHAASYSAKSS